MTGILIKRGDTAIDIVGRGHMMTEAEIKEMYPHAREHLEPSEAGGDEERFSAREVAWSCWHTFITNSCLQNCETINFYFIKASEDPFLETAWLFQRWGRGGKVSVEIV